MAINSAQGKRIHTDARKLNSSDIKSGMPPNTLPKRIGKPVFVRTPVRA